MKKKIIVILLALLVPAASLMATPWIQVGANVGYGIPMSSENLDGEFVDGFSDLQNYKFGAEARINLFDWVSLAVPGTFTLDFTQFNLQPSVNLNLPLGFLDIALGVGTNMEIAYDNNEWKMNGEPFSKAGNAFLDSNFLYRGALTFNLGFLGIGLAAAVPSSGSFSQMGELDAWTPQWENTTLSASVLVNFF